ncbi:hypothetical protein KIN20_014897 [Parelaphostrongylus tenuis]|uniref:Uncharacterized protein n=1 Tax=Parelaphostrongylus tenuis TaxID=148309 RepID=A0AAD5QLW4_PARTN|nr:hypothetical protein KIN20_014897 [Parelaphostrongylus tenuis]
MDDCHAAKGRIDYVLGSAQLVKDGRPSIQVNGREEVKWSPGECKRPLGRLLKRWADVFAAGVNCLHSQGSSEFEFAD